MKTIRILTLVASLAILAAGCASWDKMCADLAQPTTPPVQSAIGGPPPPPPPPPPPAPDADEAVGGILTTVGTILGVPLLAGAGYGVGRVKPIRRMTAVLAEVIGSVQVGRGHLAARDQDTLKRFDKMVAGSQSDKTAKFIKRLKKKAHMLSVTPDAGE